jgi:hypothetical protein
MRDELETTTLAAEFLASEPGLREARFFRGFE